MNLGEEFHESDQRTLTLLKQTWGFWTGLSFFIVFISGIGAIIMAIGSSIYSHYAFPGVFMVVGAWVLLLCNIYIKFGLDKLDYFRWKLLVIESGLIGIGVGYASVDLLMDLKLDFISNVGLGFCLAILYLAFKVRDEFRKT